MAARYLSTPLRRTPFGLAGSRIQQLAAADMQAEKANREFDNEQTAFDNRQGMLKDILNAGVSGSQNAFGAAPQVPTDNRFAAGLTDAESRLRALLDNPDSINQSAAYKFRVGQGQEALQRSMGARGMLNSGNRLMELTKYGQDMGSQEYDAQYGRLGNLLGNYSTGYVADKNANTNLFGAQATAYNQAQSNADRNRLGFASLAWDMNKPQGGGAVIRSSGGQSQPLYQFGSSSPSDPWAYNTGSYSAGTGESWYTNDKTGEQQKRWG